MNSSNNNTIIGVVLFFTSIAIFMITNSFFKILYWFGFLAGIALFIIYMWERYKSHPIYDHYDLTELEQVETRLSLSGFKKAKFLEEVKVKNEIAGFILKEGNMQYHLRLIKQNETEFGISIHYEYANSNPAHLLGFNDEEKAIFKMIEVLT
ncbi:MAG: hypothetical protein ACFE96_15245 [Candidatus Hermodarchaeota archaeon]